MTKLLRRQRGVAVITALLLTTLAVTIVASLFWTQQVQVRSMENQRLHLQTKWILRGGLDWSKFVLARFTKAGKTSLLDPWNVTLQDTRLDQYIDRERVQGEVFDASLAGRIVDATSRYNLTNLSQGPVVSEANVAVYRRLLVNLQLDPALARRTADMVAKAAPPAPKPLDGDGSAPPEPCGPQPPRTSAPMALTQVDDLLSIPGYTPEIVQKLREFVIVLPTMVGESPVSPTAVNVNTASAEVISALVPGLSLSQAQAVVARRKQADYNNPSRFVAQLHGVPDTSGLAPEMYSITSEWFLVLARVRLDRAALDSEALVHRPQMASPGMAQKAITVWVRQN